MGDEELERLIGQLAIRFHMLSPQQVEQALAAYEYHEDEHAGEAFLASGMLTEGQIAFLLAIRRFKAHWPLEQAFADRVVAEGWAERREMNAALEKLKRLVLKKHRVVRFGDLLVHDGIITSTQRDQLLHLQGRLEQAPESVAKAVETVTVTVADDHLQAAVAIGEGGSADASTILAALRQRGVTHGIDNAAVQALAGKPGSGAAVVARGTASKPPVDAHIEYGFDVHPLKAGRQDDSGLIDFRDRGEIPQVAAGAVLARKVPAQDGTAGIDVFGQALLPGKPRDCRIGAGRGARLEPDRVTVVAEEPGHPAISATGVISVFPEYRIEGDLGYNTGHVDFNGRVVVTGAVQSGFRVRCGELVANELEDCDVHAEGDVEIKGGVIGARVRADGIVHARYLHNARLQVLGDVIVDREVVDSDVESSGAFHGERCVVYDTRISAKHGIFVKSVGSDSSPPCRLTFGIDERVLADTAEREAAIGEQEEALVQLAAEQSELKAQLAVLDKQIGDLAQVQDQALVKLRALSKGADAAERDPLERTAAEAEQRLAGLFEAQEKTTAALDALVQREEEAQRAIDEHRQSIRELREWAEQNPGEALLRVDGILHGGTLLKSPHLEVRTQNERKRVWLVEQEVETEQGGSEWRLVPR